LIVNSYNTHNPKIKIIEIIGVIRGDAAIKLQRCSCDYLDKGDCYQLINLKYAKDIDGMGINVLENLINRGVCIRLFNVRAEIRKVIRMSGKEDIFKVYNEQDSHKAVSMFEKEILEQSTAKDDIRKREYSRADAFFKADFKYHPGHNGVFSGRATILNLSEGGMFADQVLAMDAKTEDIFIPEKLAGQELYGVNFILNKDSKPIETEGVCVREFRDEGKLCAGIRFKGMKQEYKEMIKEYVQGSLQYYQ
jgi:anti-anti-sigma regulatory factor